MSDIAKSRPAPGYPTVVPRKRHISAVWLIPALAAVIGLSMLVHAWLSVGPDITITFETAEGLDAGKTPVKYKDVTVGTVTAVDLNKDASHVIARVSLVKDASPLLRADTRFWVVRPRIGLGGVSGIDTLISGAYIGVDRGTAQSSTKTFTGLETPPSIIHGVPGTSFTIHADDLGSLDIGSPVYYRRIQVGRIASYQLDADGHRVNLGIFVNAPYDHLVVAGTRFWNASGIDVSLGADGLKLNTQSLTTVMAGGIAFATPTGIDTMPAPALTAYELAKDEQAAMAPSDGPAQYLQLRFDHSLHGLSMGAPVQFAGMVIGHVTSIGLDYNAAEHRFPTIVDVEIYPSRLGGVLARLPKYSGDDQQRAAQFLAGLVEHGLRAQARPGNLLTGQLYIDLDFVPNAPPATFDVQARPLLLPTVNGSFDQMQEQMASIVAKIDRMPLEAIGRHVDASLIDLDRTLRQVNGQVLPATTHTMQAAQQTLGTVQSAFAEDAPLQQNVTETLLEMQRTARSLRTLTDLLGRHPESLLRGNPTDPKPKANPVQESTR
jgi:paraquat-inducible protein B